MDTNARALLSAIGGLIIFLGASGQPGRNTNTELKTLAKVKVIPNLKSESGKKIIPDVMVRNENGAVWKNGISPKKPEIPLDSNRRFKDRGKQPGQSITLNSPNATVNSSINGITFSNIQPPDPTMAVGPNHIIQMTNGTSGSLFRITNKSGTVLVPSTFLDQVTGYGGFADPIALYDHLADRFIMMEMVNSGEVGSYGICIAISQTPNPTAGWNAYLLNTGANLPDFPKISMWPDAYYITANEFTNAQSYAGTYAYALERNTMISGLANPQVVRIRLGLQPKHQGACPVTLQGTTSDSSANGLIAWLADDGWSTWDPNDTDSIGLFKFNVNWANPAASNIINFVSLSSLPFKSNVCTASRGRCIPQTGTSAVLLEALHQKVMNQPVYRAFAGYQGVVMTHTTDAGNEKAGIRWYELRKNNIASNWSIGQQSTWSPDATHRFMPSISYNKRGDIALAYNVSDTNGTYPGIRFTGRRSCDAPGTMTVPETNIVAGGSFSANSRFGDYNHLVADPSNGSFWVTGQYMPTTQWDTRIARFSFDSCVESCGNPVNLLTQNITPYSATLSWAAGSGISYYSVEYKKTTDTPWLSAGNSTSNTLNLANLEPGQHFSWRVKAWCDYGNSNFSESNFATPLPPCNTPDSATVTNITNTTATLRWKPVAEAQNGYLLEYKKSLDSGWTAQILPGAATQMFALTALTDGAVYLWRIKSLCISGESNGSPEMTFRTNTPVCPTPVNLQTSLVTTTSARLSWSKVPENNGYQLEYKTATQSSWTVLQVNPTDTIYNLSGLAHATAYNWRVKATCLNPLESNWATANFSTLTEECLLPTGLQTTLVTINSARLNWVPAAAGQQTILEYQVTGATSWINLPVSQGAQFYNLSGLAEATSYTWRMRTVCIFTQSTLASQSFTTSRALCAPPANLLAGDITAGSADLSWTIIGGATSYRVEYQKTGTTTWTLLTASTNTNKVFLSGLSASTAYNWRVSATCPQNTTAFSQSSFSTTGSCTTPASVTTTNITSNSATLGWGSIRSVSGFRAEYKTTVSTTWTVLPNTNSSAKSINLTGLLPATAYQWRVRTICSAGTSMPSAIQSFTTFAPPCPDPYEPNNSNKALAPIPVKTDIIAAISSGTDQDWFSFSNTRDEPNIRLSLTQLPANYTLTLYSPAGKALVKSAKTGLTDETISLNTTTVGKYWIQVIPASGADFNPSACYRLRANIQAGTNLPETDYTGLTFYPDEVPDLLQGQPNGTDPGKETMVVYPNPAKNRLMVEFKAPVSGFYTVTLSDHMGRVCKEISVTGTPLTPVDISNLNPGVYIVQAKMGQYLQMKKIIIRP